MIFPGGEKLTCASQYPTNKLLQAPSWSWASVDGKINFPEISGNKFIEALEANLAYVNKGRYHRWPLGWLNQGPMYAKYSVPS